jgi:hypothetical protein
MNKEKQKILVEKYPDFFKYYMDRVARYPLMFGIECDDGWFTLLDILMGNIKNHLHWNCEDKTFNITQIKEKFGGLRFYYQGGDERIDGMVHMAESMSYHLCEFCGTTHNVGQTEGWIVVCCKDCFDAGKTKGEVWKSNEDLEKDRKNTEDVGPM